MKDGGADGWEERGQYRRIGRRWVGHRDVKKVGLVKGWKEGGRGRRIGRRLAW